MSSTRPGKNRSILVIAVTALTILALASAAALATSIIKRQTASMPVDVNAFEDLNLRDLLDTAKRNEADLEQAKLDLSRIQGEEAAALGSIDRELSATTEAIQARGLASTEEGRRIAQAKALSASQKAAVTARYSTSLATGQAKVKAIQDKIDSYDKRLSDQSRKQQELLDNQNKLNDLEKQGLVKSYEGRIQDLRSAAERDAVAAKRQRQALSQGLTERWNPVFTDPETAGLLTDFTNPPDTGLQPWDDSLQKAGVMSRAEYEEMAKSHERSLGLSFEAQGDPLPQLGSTPPWPGSNTRPVSSSRPSPPPWDARPRPSAPGISR